MMPRKFRPKLKPWLWIISLVTTGALQAAVFTVTTVNPTGPGSLFQAISDANGLPGPDQIVFNIPGSGVHAIDLSSIALPVITDTVSVDGYTQPGATPNSLSIGNNAVILIQLDGGGPFSPVISGVVIAANDCVIRGLSLTGFSSLPGTHESREGSAVAIDSPSILRGNRNRIEGNFIGLAPDGMSASGSYSGVLIFPGEQNVVGGTSPDKRNVIAGNRIGVHDLAFPTTVAGNYIGVDVSGLRQGYGNSVGISSLFGTVIGGTDPGAGNVISDNDTGVLLGDEAIVQGNVIGPYADGSPAFGNDTGIRTIGAENRIGGLGAGEANMIAFNRSGIRVTVLVTSEGPRPSSNNGILSNLMYANSFLDIDLNGDGPTPNDFTDTDEGPNFLQNFPVITSVTRSPGSTTVTGGLNSVPSSSFTLQFFANGAAPAAPQTLLGTETVATNSFGDAPFSFTFPVATSPDLFITATATSPGNDTSEFFPPDGTVEFANISTRGNVGTGDEMLIGGFIVEAGPSRPFLIRVLGPSLNLNGNLSDPELLVVNSNGAVVVQNDNWQTGNEQAIRDSGLAPSNDLEPAVLRSLGGDFFANKSYTVQVRGINGGSGIAIVEVYALDSDSSFATSELLNISTRGRVGTGNDVMIGGVIVQGSSPQRVIVRAIGPDLADAGVPGPLLDPTLELRDAEGNLLAANDNWRTTQEQEIIASGLAPQDDRNSAIVATLFPASYTAIVRGSGDSSGIALVELYEIE